MNQQQMIEAHITALRGLYERIAEVAKGMGGKAREGVSGFRRNVDVLFPRRVPHVSILRHGKPRFRIRRGSEIGRIPGLKIQTWGTHFQRQIGIWATRQGHFLPKGAILDIQPGLPQSVTLTRNKEER